MNNNHFAFSVSKDASLDKLTKYFEIREYPKQNLLYWGIKFKILWEEDESVDIRSFGSNIKNIIDRLDLELNRKIQQYVFPNHAIQITGLSVPKYLMDMLGTNITEITDKDLTSKELEELSNRVSPSKDFIRIYPLQEFYKMMYKNIKRGYMAGGEIKNWAKDILTNLYFSKFSLPYFVPGYSKQTSRSENNDEILTFVNLGLACLFSKDMSQITDNTYFTNILPIILRNQKRWVRKIQLRHIINFFQTTVIKEKYPDVRKKNYLSQIITYANFSHLRHYLKYSNLSKIDKDNITMTLDYLTGSRNIQGRKEKKLRKMMKNKWIPENQLVTNFNRNPIYVTNQFPLILEKAIKMKDDEFPIIEFISFIYTLPEILEKRDNKSIAQNIYEFKSVYNNLMILKYLIYCNYKPFREISSYAKEEILGAIDTVFFSIKEKTIDITAKPEPSNNFFKISKVPLVFSEWNKFITTKCRIFELLIEDTKIVELSYEEKTSVYKSYIESYKKDKTITIDIKKKTIDPDDEWILGWSSVFSNQEGENLLILNDDELTIEQEYANNNSIPKGLMDKIFEDSFPTENPYVYLQFVYHVPTKKVIVGFNSSVCNRKIKGSDTMKGLVKIWKPESFLRYIKPLFQLL